MKQRPLGCVKRWTYLFIRPVKIYSCTFYYIIIQAVWAIAYEERHVEALRKIYSSIIREPVSDLEFCHLKGFSYYCKTGLCGVSEKSGLPSARRFYCLWCTRGSWWTENLYPQTCNDVIMFYLQFFILYSPNK